jgi:hypothetical protein
MKIRYDGPSFSYVVVIEEEELINGGIAVLVKNLAESAVLNGNLPTYDATRCSISQCNVMTYTEHQDESLPDKYVYVC